MSNRTIRRTNRRTVFVSRLTLLVLSLLIIYPIIFVLFTSVKTNQEFYSNIWWLPSEYQWSNFTTAWYTGRINLYFMNSIIVVSISVFLTTFVSLAAGYALAKLHIPKAELIMMAFMLFTFVPGISVYIPLFIQMAKMRLLNSYLTLILPYMAWQIPFSMYIFKRFFQTIPSELIESARVDGGKEYQTFYKVVLPLVRPAIATVVVFNFVAIWGELLWATITTAASVSYRTLPIGLLNFKTDTGVQWGEFAAGISIVIIPLFVLFLYTQKYFIQGLTSGAVKG